jgi:hypothetical protein
MEEAIDF